jgi:hypothetical protein
MDRERLSFRSSAYENVREVDNTAALYIYIYYLTANGF